MAYTVNNLQKKSNYKRLQFHSDMLKSCPRIWVMVMKWGMWRILNSAVRTMKSWDWVVSVLFGFNYSLGSLFWNYNQAIRAAHHQLLSLLGSINWNSRSHGVLAAERWAHIKYKTWRPGPVCSLETLIINNISLVITWAELSCTEL